MPQDNANIRDAIVRYYSEASQDYEAWSRSFNMHFGYWRAGLNPFRLEPMLDEMTRQVVKRLKIDRGLLLDMGSGLGGPARCIVREADDFLVHAVTVVGWQTHEARKLAIREGAHSRVQFVQSDYRRTPFPNEAYDGAYAIESACHADGPDKAAVVHEAARSHGVGAEIAAIVAEKGMFDLRGPIRRVTGYDVVMPLFRREMDYLPSVGKITSTIKAALDD